METGCGVVAGMFTQADTGHRQDVVTAGFPAIGNTVITDGHGGPDTGEDNYILIISCTNKLV
jgi:hypothetical protein